MEVAVATPMTSTQGPSSVPAATFDINGETSDSNVLEFNLFDPSLGDLTGVAITLTSTPIEIDPAFVAPSSGVAESQQYFNFGGDFVVDFSNASGDPFFNSWFQTFLGVEIACFYDGDGEFVDCDPAVGEDSDTASQSSSYNSPSSLANFVGVGSFDVTFDLVSEAPDPVAFAGSTFAWQTGGTLEIEYTYEQTRSVPEPGSIALLALGLAALGAGKRSKKKSLSRN